MKITLLWGAFLLLICLSEAQTISTRYSSDWLPVSGPQIQQQVRMAVSHNNATELYNLWGQACAQKKYWSYAITLREVIQQQPQNAPALATYSLVMLELMRDAGRSANFEQAKQRYFGDDLTPKGILARIEQAKKLDPKQWPLWVTASQIVPFPGGTPNGGTYEAMSDRSEAFARRAIALENNSFTNSALAYALSSRASWESKPSIYNRAIIAATRAPQMQPVSVQAKAFLLGLYRDRKKNPVKAQQVRKEIAATIPPGIKLSEAAKLYLRQLGII